MSASIFSADAIRGLLGAAFPMLKQIWLEDRQFESIAPSEVLDIAKAVPVRYKRTHGEVWDCDDIAREIVQKCHKVWFDRGEKRPPAIGKCNGIRFNGTEENHTTNIFFDGDTVYLFDAQLHQYWTADFPNDFIFKVDL